MIKVKDGYAKLIGENLYGDVNRVLLSNGGDKIIGNKSEKDFRHIKIGEFSITPNLGHYGSSLVKSTLYYKISITGVTNIWTMLNLEISLTENHGTPTYGKLLIYVEKNNSNSLTLKHGTLVGNFSTLLKVYCYYDGDFNIYIAGNWGFPTIEVTKALFGDTAALYSAKDITLTYIDSLPSAKVEVPISIGLTSTNYYTTLDERYYTETEANARFVNVSGDTMNSGAILTFPKTSYIVLTSDATSNYVSLIKWYKGTSASVTGTYDAQIGWHNTGDTDGAIVLLPHTTTSNPWNTNVGLFIGKNTLKWENNILLHSGNYTSYTVKKDGTGATGTWGINITGSSKSINVGTASGDVDYPVLFTTSTSASSNAALYIDADKKVTFNPSTNTLKASIFNGALGDGTMNLYALYSNEINFGGSGNASTIYFGYRASDSKPIPTEFVFGRGLASLKSGSITVGGSIFLDTGDATLKIYSGKISDAKSDGNICFLTCFDGLNGETHLYPVDYPIRNNIILLPRGGQVYIGHNPGDSPSSNYKLNVGGKVYATGYYTETNDRYKLLRSDGGFATFTWSGQSGLPNWVWGGNGIDTYYIYNPANFKVALASKLGDSTVGASNKPIYLSSGSPVAVTSVGEAFLSWGGLNFAGSFGPIDAAMIPTLGANRLAFVNPDKVSVEYSTNSGTTWVDYEATNYLKTSLFCGSGSADLYIGKSSAIEIDKTAYLVRVTLTTKDASIYTTLNKFAVYISTNGSSGCYCTVTARLQSNIDNNVDTWKTFANKIRISGWSEWNIINLTDEGLTTYGNNTTSLYGQIRFTFGVESHASTVKYGGLNVKLILGFGGMGHSTPSNMAKFGTIYAYDTLQRVTFPSSITSTGFIKSNSSDSYILLGGGGHKALSDFVAANGGTSTNSDYLTIHDVRATDHLPNSDTYPLRRLTSWFNDTGTPYPYWHSGITVKGWTNDYATWLLCSVSNSGVGTSHNLYFRHGINSTWGNWKTILDSSNSSVSKSGETLSVKINGTTQSLTNTWRSITDSYSGTSTSTSLSLKGANTLYNALVDGNAATLEGYSSDKFVKKDGGYPISTTGTTPYAYVHLFRIAVSSTWSNKSIDFIVRTRNYKFDFYINIDTGAIPYGYDLSASLYNIIKIYKETKTARSGQLYYLTTEQTSGYNYFDIYLKTSSWLGGYYDIINIGGTGTLIFEDKRIYLDSLPSGCIEVAETLLPNSDKLDGYHASSFALASQIPSVGNGTITIKLGGTSKGSFTMNLSGNATIELSDSNTTYSAGTGLSLSGTTFNINAGNEFPEASSALTDGTLILTSYASDNGFDDADSVGIVYKRKASCIYEYIKGKLDGVYQAKGSYLTSHQTIYNLTLLAGTFSATTFDPNGSAKTVNIPTNTSHLTNDSGFITNASLSSYLPLSGGTMTGSIIIPADNSKGIIPNTNNCGLIGSDTKKFYRMYASTFYGNLSGTATKATLDGNGNNISDTYFKYRGHLTSNANFDTYFNGSYVNTTGNGSGNTNNIHNYGYLLAFPGEASSSSYYSGAQIAIASDSRFHFRVHWNYTWSDWTRLITTDDIDKYLPLSGGTITGNLLVVGTLKALGDKFYTDASGVYWSSDRRLKDNINSARKLNIDSLIKEFDWKDTGKHSWGFIALELLEVLPEAVNYNKDTDRYSVNYDVAHSAAIASLNAKIKLLELRIKELEDGKASNE